MSSHLINQLNELKVRIHAPAVWREQTRERLLNMVNSAPKTSYSFRARLRLIFSNVRYAVAPIRLAPALSTLALVALVAVPFTQAMNQSLPGSNLYGLKRLSERVELSLYNTPQSQGVFYLKLADRRLYEAAAVASAGARADLLRDYNIDLSFAQASLQSLRNDNALAATYDAFSQTLLAKLHTLKISQSAEPAYDVSLALTEKLSSRTLAYLVDSATDVPSDQPVTERLNQQIAKVTAKLDGVDIKLVKLPTNKPAPRVVIESQAAVVLVKEASQQAKQNLTEAKELIQKKQFGLALEKLEESDDIATKSEAAVNKVQTNDPNGKVKGDSTNKAMPNDKEQNSNQTPSSNDTAQPNDNTNAATNVKTDGAKAEVKADTVKQPADVKSQP